MALLTVDDARLAIGVTDADSSVDDLLDGYVAGITAVIERYLGQAIDERQVTEVLWLSGHREFILSTTPVVTLDSLTTVDSITEWVLDSLTVDTTSGVVRVNNGTAAPYGLFTAVYTVGYETAPAAIKQGALVALKELWDAERGVGTERAGVLDPSETFDTGEVLSRKARAWLGPPRSALP